MAFAYMFDFNTISISVLLDGVRIQTDAAITAAWRTFLYTNNV